VLAVRALSVSWVAAALIPASLAVSPGWSTALIPRACPPDASWVAAALIPDGLAVSPGWSTALIPGVPQTPHGWSTTLIPDGLVVIAAVTNGNATSVVGRDSFSDGRAGGARRRDKTFIYFIWRRLTGSYAGSPGGGSTWVVSSSQLSFRCDLAPVINHCTMTLHGTTDRLAACASLFRIHFNRRRRPSQPAAASYRHVIVPQSAT